MKAGKQVGGEAERPGGAAGRVPPGRVDRGAAVDEVESAASVVRDRLVNRKPRVAVVLGSGLGFLADQIGSAVRIPYSDIPGFPSTTVIGHGAELVAGQLAGTQVIVQSGRFHLYEGHDASITAFPARVFASLGVDILILTNAAGGIRRTFSSGTVMLIADHINLTFRNPLFGPCLSGEERFPDMSDPYDRELRSLAREVSRTKKIALDEGVYIQLLGPSYETPAEIRMADRLGADAVGMSTAVEVIAARARGLRCLGFSVVTNLASGISPTKLNHAEVMETANRVRHELAGLVEGVIERL
jgi:purine-nucleoside phosphorylase